MDIPRVRKSVAELSLNDLDLFPAWEFALDEEGQAGQDESTVRPLEVDEVDASAGTFVVRARFRLADGTQLRGYLTPPDEGVGDLGTLQPVIVTDQGQVLFWWGTISPPASALSEAYARLGKSTPDQVFPIQFSSDFPILGGPVQGELPGFLHLDDWRTGKTTVVA